MTNILPLEIKIGTTFGPIEIRAKRSDGSSCPLAGWIAHAQVRLNEQSPLILDLQPTIAANDADGLITIPAVAPAQTAHLAAGLFRWDLILQTPEGAILNPPLVSGPVTIGRNITQIV
jgi:hypothetical protein